MAAGVRSDLIEVERVLSHWVTDLRFCNVSAPCSFGEACSSGRLPVARLRVLRFA